MLIFSRFSSKIFSVEQCHKCLHMVCTVDICWWTLDTTKAGFIQDPNPHFPIIQNLRRVKSVEITNQISEQFLFKVSLSHLLRT